MLEFFRLTKFLPATLILLTAKVACSLPVSGSYKYPVAPSSDTMPICYVQKADSITLHPSSLCEKVAEVTTLAEQSEDEDEPTTLAEQSEDEDEPTTLAEQRQYKADMNVLRNQIQKLPDKDTLINHICNSLGKCPSRIDNIEVSVIEESPSPSYPSPR